MNDTVIKANYEYIVDLAEILGANRELAAKEFKESLEFEMQLAKVCSNIYCEAQKF